MKKSLSIIPGKNDRIDAQRRSRLACLHQLSLTTVQLPAATLLKRSPPGLKNLLGFRDGLTKTNIILKQTLQAFKEMAALLDNQFIIKESEKQLNLIQQQLHQTDQ